MPWDSCKGQGRSILSRIFRILRYVQAQDWGVSIIHHVMLGDLPYATLNLDFNPSWGRNKRIHLFQWKINALYYASNDARIFNLSERGAKNVDQMNMPHCPLLLLKDGHSLSQCNQIATSIHHACFYSAHCYQCQGQDWVLLWGLRPVMFLSGICLFIYN